MFIFSGLGFTAKPATKTSKMKRSSRNANAKTVSVNYIFFKRKTRFYMKKNILFYYHDIHKKGSDKEKNLPSVQHRDSRAPPSISTAT
jgi:hypothetical protein